MNRLSKNNPMHKLLSRSFVQIAHRRTHQGSLNSQLLPLFQLLTSKVIIIDNFLDAFLHFYKKFCMNDYASIVQTLFNLFHPSFLLFFLSFWVADSEGQCLVEIPSSSWVSAVNLSYAFSMKSPMNRWYLMTLLNHDFMHMFYLMYS